jgi:hypothetical protein
MLKPVIALCLSMLLAGLKPAEEPVELGWKTLENIEFEQKYIKEVNAYMLFPVFTPELKSLNGKMVKVTGYVIPVDKTGSSIALSANPFAACFFCGKAGPASVLTVKLRKPTRRFRTDQWRSFAGRLRLNATDIYQFYYIIEEGEEIKK